MMKKAPRKEKACGKDKTLKRVNKCRTNTEEYECPEANMS
jgi:predicted RNA-binding Zn-ribbon protein involved in translation (DUF1610 family)